MVDEINEKSLSGAQRYYMHSQAHDQAAQKYSISSKSVDPAQAKIHRKLGRFHKTISAALSQIAGVHTSNDFNRSMKKKAENMANKKVNEEHLDEVEEENEMFGDYEPDDFEEGVVVSEHVDMFNALYDCEPGAFASAFSSLMQRKALDRIEEIKIDLAQTVFDGEDVQEDVEQVDELMGKGKLNSYAWDQEKRARYHADRVGDDIDAHHDDYSKSIDHSINADRARALKRRADTGASLRRAKTDHEKSVKDSRAMNPDSSRKYRFMAKEDVEQVDEISGKTLGSYVQKARADAQARNDHNKELDTHPSVKKHLDDRRELVNQRVGYDKHGRSKNRPKIDKTYEREGKAKSKLDPDYLKKSRKISKRYRGVEKAIKKLESGKLTD